MDRVLKAASSRGAIYRDIGWGAALGSVDPAVRFAPISDTGAIGEVLRSARGRTA